MPKFEVPAAFREAAEKGVAQAKEGWEKMKSATEEATEVLEESYTTAAKGASEYGLKVIDAARTNTNAAFDFATNLATAKTLSEFVEISSAACPQAVRHGLRADQGTDLAGAEGYRRHGRAAQDRLHQRLQEGCVITGFQPPATLSKPGPRGPGFSLSWGLGAIERAGSPGQLNTRPVGLGASWLACQTGPLILGSARFQHRHALAVQL